MKVCYLFVYLLLFYYLLFIIFISFTLRWLLDGAKVICPCREASVSAMTISRGLAVPVAR